MHVMYIHCLCINLSVFIGRGSPRNVEATSIDPASLRVQWEPPPDINKASITGYVIEYTRIGSNDKETTKVARRVTSHTIQELVASQGYLVRVATMKDNKIFAFSDDVVQNAGEDGKLCMHMHTYT